VTTTETTIDGVRLLSHRPSVLYKVEHLGTVPASGDLAVEGLAIEGQGWEERLRGLLAGLSASERASLLAVRLGDERALPLPASVLLDRRRTDWFPSFLSHGLMRPHFQPIVDLATGQPVGREALMRGRLGAVEVRGGELIAAAEAHDALFSFDTRARAAALEVGLPLMTAGEVLFVNVDPRAVIDVEASVRSTWPIADRFAGDVQVCLELVDVDACPDVPMLEAMVTAHRRRGALISLDDLSGGAAALRCLEVLRPDFAKIDLDITSGIQHSVGRRRLVAALVECAHEVGARVVAEGIERVDEFEAMRDLGVDLGQGYYFGHPAERPMPVDPRLVRRTAFAAGPPRT
jgi:EAL domain-containing protein (putative c-di-GMP-specific phosphodiesterase class I)